MMGLAKWDIVNPDIIIGSALSECISCDTLLVSWLMDQPLIIVGSTVKKGNIKVKNKEIH